MSNAIHMPVLRVLVSSIARKVVANIPVVVCCVEGRKLNFASVDGNVGRRFQLTD